VTYYALTEKGYDRVEAGLRGRGSMDAVLGALADLEEVEPLKPHTLLQIMKETGFEARTKVGLQEAIRRGYVEEVQPGDERFR